MSVELPDDLAEALADRHGVYSDQRCVRPFFDPLRGEIQHIENCECRAFWVPALKQRMRDAVHAEDKLNAPTGPPLDAWPSTLRPNRMGNAGAL